MDVQLESLSVASEHRLELLHGVSLLDDGAFSVPPFSFVFEGLGGPVSTAALDAYATTAVPRVAPPKARTKPLQDVRITDAQAAEAVELFKEVGPKIAHIASKIHRSRSSVRRLLQRKGLLAAKVPLKYSAYAPYSSAELATAMDLCRNGVKCGEIAKTLGRSRGGVRQALQRQGLIPYTA
mgnify:FL=1